MMIGTPQEAQYIRDAVISFLIDNDTYELDTLAYGLQDGWEYMGKGCFRSVWRGPSGAVYKVQHRYWGGGQDNDGEYANALRLTLKCRPVPNVRLPRFTLFELDGRSVIAMECVDGPTLEEFGDEDGYGDLYENHLRGMNLAGVQWDLQDLHEENVMVDIASGELVVVDLGY